MELAETFATHHASLAPHFNPAILQRAETTFQMLFDEDNPFYLKVDHTGNTESSFHFTEGVHDKPTLTLYVDCHESFWDLLYGRTDSMSAFMDGRYRADGNIVLSQLLLYLFANNHPAVAYEVQD